MAIYSDSIGNHFLGDCIYGNHRIDYPTISHLRAHPINTISSELTALCTTAGLNFRNVLPQADWDTGALGKSLLTFGGNSDSIDDRYCFNSTNFFSSGSNGGASGTHLIMYNDSGYTLTNNNLSITNAVLGLSNSNPPVATSTGTGTYNGNAFQSPQNTAFNTPIYVVGCSDGESLALAFYQHQLNTNTWNMRFYYAGILEDINSNYNYYSQNSQSSSVLFSTIHVNNFTTTWGLTGGHRISGAGKLLLTTGDAQYPIVCADGQTPTTQWATDMYVFDDNPSLGYPAMGKVRNLLLAQGTFTIGKPVRISPSVYPDAGFNAWLPVGTFAGKTVLMRCYSSVDL